MEIFKTYHASCSGIIEFKKALTSKKAFDIVDRGKIFKIFLT